MITVDIGNLCTHCGRSTAFSPDPPHLFVNRIPSGASGMLYFASPDSDEYIEVGIEGFMCVDCQMIECDRCGEMTLEYATIEDDNGYPSVVCDDCEVKQ